MTAKCLAAWLLLASTALAQTGSFDWSTSQSLGSYAGLRWATVNVTSPRTMSINCLQIDTTTPGLRFYATPQSGTSETMTQTTRQFITTSRTTATPVVAAINAGPWSPFTPSTDWNQSRAVSVTGLAVSQGALVSPATGAPSFIVSTSGAASTIPTYTSTNLADVQTAVTGFWSVLSSGSVLSTDTNLHPRTGIGVSQDRRYVFFMTIDGRQPASDGATGPDVGSFLRWFGAYDGINMDGGGSTTMAWWNPTTSSAALLNSPRGQGSYSSSNSERFNGNNIGIYYSSTAPAPPTVPTTAWTTTSGTAWNTAGNWSNGTPATTGSASSAVFPAGNTQHATPTLTAEAFLATVTFEAGAQAYTVQQSGQQNFRIGNLGGITVNAGVTTDQNFTPFIRQDSNGDALLNQTISIVNNGSGSLNFNATDSFLDNGGGSGTWSITFGGSGNIRVNRITNRSSGSTVGFIKTGTGTLTILDGQTSAAPNTTTTGWYTGATAINGGVVQLGNQWSLSGSGTSGISFGGGTLRYSGSNNVDYSARIRSSGSAISLDTAGRSVTFASSLDSTNTGGLTKSGSGSLTLTASNAYTGPTAVNAGSLLVNGRLGTTAVTVNSGATLGGSGTIAGAVSVMAGGTFSPGTSPGLLSVGSLVLAGTTLMEIDGTTRGTLYDGTNVTGALAFGGSLLIDFGAGITGPFANGTTLDLFDYGSFSGGFTSITTVSDGSWYGGLSFASTGNGDVWTAMLGGQTLEFTHSTGTLAVVPEPGALVLAGVGIAAIAGFIRPRRKSRARTSA